MPDSKWVWKKGDTEVETDRDADQMWTPQQAADWCDQIDELLEPSPTPMVWIDDGVEEEERPEPPDSEDTDGTDE